MDTKEMNAVVHYRHCPEEVAELAGAIVPLNESIRRVSNHYQRQILKAILMGDFFRYQDAAQVKGMLLRAVKHSRATLGEFFPMLQAQALMDAQALEDATNRYWRKFATLREETIPVH